MSRELAELVTPRQAELVVAAVCLGVPLLALVLGAAIGRARLGLGRGLSLGALIGLLGPLGWVLWLVYNLVINRYGLDSVQALLINLALFSLAGVMGGAALGWAWRRLAAKS